MSAAQTHQWLPIHRGGRLEELDQAECRRLLTATTIGRLGYETDDGPRVVPMNFLLSGDDLTFRTSAHGEVARLAIGRPVCFEVDEVDEFLQTGWSVQVRGVAQEISSEATDAADLPDPWPVGQQFLLVRIPLAALSGRRVHQA